MATTASLISSTSASASNSALLTAVSGTVKTDVTKALTAAGLGAYAGSQQSSDLVAKLSQDAVTALQSPGSQGALASLSKIITDDVGSVLNQYGMGAAAGSSQMADFTKGLAADVMTAAQSAGYGQTTSVTSASTSATTAPTSATLAAVSGSLTNSVDGALKSMGASGLEGSSAMTNLIGQMTKDIGTALSAGGDVTSTINAVLTKDVTSTLQGMGYGAYASSSAVTSFVAQMGKDALGAAQASMASQAAAATSTVKAPTAAPTVAASTTTSPAANSGGVSASSVSSASAAVQSATQSASATTGTTKSTGFSTDDTVASILKALAPLTGAGSQFSGVVGRIADMLGRSGTSGGSGVALSSVADKLHQDQASAAAVAAAAASTTSSGTTAASTSSTAATRSSPSTTATSALTNAQSASITLASMLAQNGNSLKSFAFGTSSSANLGASPTKNPLVLAYGAA